jgi:L(+)-tartrate dehydratase beta subunit
MTLTTPIAAGDLGSLRAGDIVYLSGRIVTARDDVHHRHLRQGMALPVDLAGGAIFHAGPIMRRTGTKGHPQWEAVSIGPTTSMRMETAEAAFIASVGIRLIVGKGGMGPATAEACKTHGAVHAVFPGGCAALAAGRVEAVEGVEWLDLGMPEAMWILRVREFGPLIVSIDTKGNNLFENNRRLFDERKEKALDELDAHLRFLH